MANYSSTRMWQTIGEAPIMPYEESGAVRDRRWLFMRTDYPTIAYPAGPLSLVGSETVKLMPGTLRIVTRWILMVAMILSHLDVKNAIVLTRYS